MGVGVVVEVGVWEGCSGGGGTWGSGCEGCGFWMVQELGEGCPGV